MVISVISPHCGGNGNTVTALFAALGLGSMKKRVLLTHTDSVSNSLYAYLGLQQFEDKTATPTQVVKLLKEGAIQPEAIPDYCKEVQDNVYVFTNNKTNFSAEDMHTLSQYLVRFSDFEYLIYDFNNTESETAKYILSKSELVILNFTQSYSELDDFKREEAKYKKMFQGKKIILVCNKFSPVVGKDKDVPKRLGQKAPCSVIHYNPWIIYGCNQGQLLNIYENIRRKNVKVIELNNDINRLASTISKLRINNMKAKQAAKKAENLARAAKEHENNNVNVVEEEMNDGGAVDA